MARWIVATLLAGSILRPEGMGLPQDQLIMDLLEDYDIDAIPLVNSTTPVVADVDFYIQSLQEIMERNQAVSLFLWVGSIWTDVRLTWDPARYSNMTSITVHGGRIWTPDLAIRNSVADMYEYLQNEHFRAIVYHNGTVRYWVGGSTTVSCILDLTYFPFDTQACYVHVCSWSYVVDWLKLKPVDKSLQTYAGSNSQWDVVTTKASYLYEEFNTGNAFDSVLLAMVFRRKPDFYNRTIVFPCILLSILGLLMFLIPMSVGDRISYGITVLLSFTVFQLMIADSLPRTSDQQPFVITYIMAVMLMTAVCIIFSVFVFNIQDCSPDKPIPRWFYILTFNILSRLSCLNPNERHPESHEGIELTEVRNSHRKLPDHLQPLSSKVADRLNWKAAGAVWDRFFFILFGLVLLVMSLVMLQLNPYLYNVSKGLNDYVIVS